MNLLILGEVMASDKTQVLHTDVSRGCEVRFPKSEKAIVDEADEKRLDEEALKIRIDEGSKTRPKPRFIRWLRKLWERECPLLPNDYFDNHGN